MNNFNRGFGGRRSFGGRGRGSFNRDDRGSRQMFKVTCSDCGKDCEVPFKPTNDKPVYCSDCFEKKGGRDGRNRGFADDKYKAQFESINAKLDKILSLLEPKVEPKVESKEKPSKVAK